MRVKSVLVICRCHLSIKPNSQIFEVHSFGVIIVDHIADNPSNSLIIVLLHQLQPFCYDNVENIIVN